MGSLNLSIATFDTRLPITAIASATKRSRAARQAEIVVLRYQLNVLRRRSPKTGGSKNFPQLCEK
jgi:hypothetical protein